MNVLLTGHKGRIGPTVYKQLVAAGFDVSGFDLADSDDILNFDAVKRAASGKQAIVHVAGIAGDRGRPPAEVMSVNLAGTINVLFAAEAQAVPRVIYLSSGRSLGMLDRAPDYLPLDDNHRGLPPSPYGLAKWLAEELCESFTQRTSIDTICLRAVAVFGPEDYRAAAPHRILHPGKTWDLGVHLDVRDLADATVAAVTTNFRGHTRILLSAADCRDDEPVRTLASRYLPDVPWRGGEEYERDSYRSLVDINKAKQILGWSPKHRWPKRTAS